MRSGPPPGPTSMTPQITQPEAQPYVAIRCDVTPETLAGAADRGFPALFGWLGDHGVAPSGPPVIRHLLVDPDGAPLELELGAPVAEPVAGDDRVRAGVLP